MAHSKTPVELVQDARQNCLQALRYCCTHVHDIYAHLNGNDPCPGCVYYNCVPEECIFMFRDFLPDILRRYGDEKSLKLADVMDRCPNFEYDEDICPNCEYFEPCWSDEEDEETLQKEAYAHLCSLGAYKED